MKDFTSHWQFYVIPDLKTWSTHAAFQTPLEHFANPADAFARFKELRFASHTEGRFPDYGSAGRIAVAPSDSRMGT